MFNSSAEIGTYAGDLVVNIGSGVEFLDISYNTNGRFSAASGQNYLTGSVEFNVNSWHEKYPVHEHALLLREHDYNKNIGSITINKGENVTNDILFTGDFNKDGKVGLSDVLLMVKYLVNENFDASEYFYGRKTISLIDVTRAVAKVVK